MGGAMKKRKADVPGYQAAEIFTRDGAQLLLPASEIDALEAACAEAKAKVVKTLAEAAKAEVAEESVALSEPDDDGFGPEAQDPARRKVFDVDEVAAMLEMHGKGDRERLTQLKSWAKQMSRDSGYREIKAFPLRFDGLREQFPNARHVIDAIESLAALGVGHEDSFMPEPMLLLGPPGIEKRCWSSRSLQSRASSSRLSRSAQPKGVFKSLGHLSIGRPRVRGRYGGSLRQGMRRTASYFWMSSTSPQATSVVRPRRRCWISWIRALRDASSTKLRA
jgi:hypothetical protein